MRRPTVLALIILGALAPSANASQGARLRLASRIDQPISRPGPSPLTLIGAQGQPIGGHWQALVDEARTTVWRGDVIFDSSDRDIDRDCGGDGADGGCFSNTDPVEIWASADRAGQFGLYHEMGHLFDYELLTDADRAAFMRIWRVTIPAGESIFDAWWRNEATANPMSWGPPAEWFAEGYRLCATYGTWTWADALAEDGDQYGYPAQNAWGVNGRSAKWAWTVRAQRATCAVIDSRSGDRVRRPVDTRDSSDLN